MPKNANIALFTSAHELLLDSCSLGENTSPCIPSVVVDDIFENALPTIKEYIHGKFDMGFPCFLGSIGLQSDHPIFVFHVNEELSYRSRLNPTRIYQALIQQSDKKLRDQVWYAYGEILLKGFQIPFEDFEVWPFGHTEEEADYLGSLVVMGRKKATSSLLWSYEHEDETVPNPGILSVITNSSGSALCVIKIERVQIVPFNSVDPGFARLEGEGDLSLEFWRKVHWDFFAEECHAMGLEPENSMPIVCEEFTLLHRCLPI